MDLESYPDCPDRPDRFLRSMWCNRERCLSSSVELVTLVFGIIPDMIVRWTNSFAQDWG
jgi:hypothetical protein